MAAVVKMKTDSRDDVAKVAQAFWLPIRIVNLGQFDDAGRKELADEVLASVTDSKFAPETIGAASQLGDALAQKNHVEEAGIFFDRLAELAKQTDEPEIQKSARQFEGIARRMRLPGSFMALEGKKLNGDDFDWSSYRGKVVLVDFWATWCGPCIGELPNVLKNYEKYHEKGFDVVAISLDRSREKLDQFIEKNELPWVQLYDEEIQKNRGWNHPLAEYFGINAIPAAFLVDADGKVITSQARGEELTKQLEQLLGKVD
jgi:thiol-disulfide isomerase/thioredoxin